MTAEPEQKPEIPAVGDEADSDILSIRVGGKTIGESLEDAITAGRVVRQPDGKLSLPPGRPAVEFRNHKPFERDCTFLAYFMFKRIYGGACVPIGCETCYKVKVEAQTMRQLMAVKKIADELDYPAKSVSEVDRPDNQCLYASYFYLTGLDEARGAYKKIRARVDADPALGPSVKLVIKRGCTHYEHACGPSDRYTFDPRLKDIEGYFRKRFVRPKSDEPMAARKYRQAATLLDIARTAYRIGDNTYKEFTGGKEVFRPTVSYDPNGSDTDEDASGLGS